MSQTSCICVRIGTLQYVRFEHVAGGWSLKRTTVRLNGKRLFRRGLEEDNGTLDAPGHVDELDQSTWAFTLGFVRVKVSSSTTVA